MTMQSNDVGYLCTWCGSEVDEIKEPDYPSERMVGTCEDDGIVYVTLDASEVNGND